MGLPATLYTIAALLLIVLMAMRPTPMELSSAAATAQPGSSQEMTETSSDNTSDTNNQAGTDGRTTLDNQTDSDDLMNPEPES